jgi:hypothetical protein
MVLINLKLGEKNQFIYETNCGIEVNELIKQLVLSNHLIYSNSISISQ